MFYVCLVTYCQACGGRERTMIWQQTFKDEYLMSLAHSNGKLDVQQQSTAINGLCVLKDTKSMSNPYKLYLVTDDQQDLATLEHVVEQAVAGGVTMVQVREKHGDVRAFIERAQRVKAILKGTGVPLIINDRVDVALAVDADGLHLGQSDMPATIARQLIGENKILGLSIENEQQLEESNHLPIDYIGLECDFFQRQPKPTLKSTGVWKD